MNLSQGRYIPQLLSTTFQVILYILYVEIVQHSYIKMLNSSGTMVTLLSVVYM